MKLLVPAYGHPYESPDLWTGLVAAAPAIGAVIINPASGAGEGPDPVWTYMIARLDGAGIPMAGYVTSAGAERPPGDLVAEARNYLSWYGLDATFIDCLPSREGPRVTEMVTALRAAGVRHVIGNSGTETDPAIAAAVDVVVDYENNQVPLAAPMHADGSHRCWIGHGLDWEQARETLHRARAAGIEWIWVTDGAGANPYRDLPSYWTELLAELNRLGVV